MGTESSIVTGLLIAAVAGLIVLIVERLSISLAERKRERLVSLYTQAFLRNWYIEVENVLTKISEKADTAETAWSAYAQRLRAAPDSDELTPDITYTRVLLPDVSAVVMQALPYLSEDAYENLLNLNSRLRILDERERRLSELYDSALPVEPNRAFRLRLSLSY